MACVTLKRPLDFDPLEALHSPNRPTHHAKRRRCTPIKKLESREPFCNPNTGKVLPSGLSPSALAAYQQQQHLRNQLHNGGMQSSSSTSSQGVSVFRETPLSPGEMADNLRDELKRMKRRRQLVPYFNQTEQAGAGASTTSSPSTSPFKQARLDLNAMNATSTSSSSSIQTAHPGSPCDSGSSPSSKGLSARALVGTKEKPVFTLKQMTIICERMCKERTDKVREEYDHILQQKLSEQYDAFVKFIDHQIQQRFNQSQLPSYLS